APQSGRFVGTRPRRAGAAARPVVIRVRLLTTALIGSTAIVLGASSTPEARAERSACSAGWKMLRGSPVHVFCGPASATVIVAGRTLRFANGSCTRGSSRFEVDLGICDLAPIRPRFRYFVL